MTIDKINFSVANIKLCYKYDQPFEIDANSAVFNFICDDEKYDIFNEIYITTDKTLLNEIKTNGEIYTKTSAWTCLKYKDDKYYIFSTDGTKDIALLKVEDDSFSMLKTYLYRNDFYGQPLPICVTGLIIQHKLLNQGFFMHGATISVNNEGIILTGNSGVGKSTLSKIFIKNCTCKQLTDDRFILINDSGEYFSYGNPLDYKIERNMNEKVKIRSIFFLKHGKENYIKPLYGQEFIVKLMTISLLPYWDKECLIKSIRHLSDLSQEVRGYECEFIPNKEIIPEIINYM